MHAHASVRSHFPAIQLASDPTSLRSHLHAIPSPPTGGTAVQRMQRHDMIQGSNGVTRQTGKKTIKPSNHQTKQKKKFPLCFGDDARAQVGVTAPVPLRFPCFLSIPAQELRSLSVTSFANPSSSGALAPLSILSRLPGLRGFLWGSLWGFNRNFLWGFLSGILCGMDGWVGQRTRRWLEGGN
jgi:hypothetical protein